MKTFALWLLIAVAAGIAALPGESPGAAAEPAGKPNFVVIVADDLGWADVPWHGSPYAMPHLAALAKSSTRLESHYVHPMCSPTRAALLTGRYASRFGVTAAQNQRALPWNTLTLARALKSAGYETAITGKWHLGSRPDEGPQKFGFDHGYGSLAGGVGPYDHRYKEGEWTRTWHRNGQLIEEEGHVTDLIAREAVQWLQGRGDKPFFLYVPFTAIHVPMREEQKWQDVNASLRDPGQRLRAACASHLDDAVGQILAALDRQKLRENTLVVFFGDNGAHAPSDNQGGAYPGEYERFRVGNDNLPYRGHKSGVYEGGIRVPCVASWPGKLKSLDLWLPMHAVDWMPTLCSLASVQLPSEADPKSDGVNVWPAISQLRPLPTRTIYTAAPAFRAQAVRHGDWKLVVTRANAKKTGDVAKEELFNLADDPSETKNLAAERPELLAQMKQRLADIAQRDNDAIAKD